MSSRTVMPLLFRAAREYVKTLDTPHMLDIIASTIEKQIASWVDRGLTKVYLVTDGGSNMRKAAEHLVS